MYFLKYKPTYNIALAFSFTLIMEILNRTIQFRRKFGNYANPSFRKIVKKRTLETVNLNKQNKHCSLILMKYLSVTLSKASILFPGEMFTSRQSTH